MAAEKKIPVPTIGRLSIYLQCLRILEQNDVPIVSSSGLAEMAGINAAQFRKDLSYFGEFGTPGVGYNVVHLKERLQEIMGLNRTRSVVLIGCGNLGSALARYPGFARQGFQIAAIFDNDLQKVGQRIAGLEILHIDRLEEINSRLGADIAIIAVPAEAAQGVAEKAVAAGFHAICNFAPVKLFIASHVSVRDVDLSRELEMLSYYLNLDEANRLKVGSRRRGRSTGQHGDGRLASVTARSRPAS